MAFLFPVQKLRSDLSRTNCGPFENPKFINRRKIGSGLHSKLTAWPVLVDTSRMGWFSPKCPLDEETRLWIDHAFGWLIEELSLETLQSVEVVEPTEAYFPDPYNGSRSAVKRMSERVCEYMDVDSKSIRIVFFDGDDESRFHPLAAGGERKEHALGSYQRGRDGKHTINLDMTQASKPEMMVATIAHELGHVILLGEGRLDEDYQDHEPMTDLVTVFYGLGIFNANSSFYFEQWTNSQFQGWRAGSAGYLTEQMFGYALALFAFHRGEQDPAWAKHLSTNVRSYLRKSSRYLARFGVSPIPNEHEDEDASRLISSDPSQTT